MFTRLGLVLFLFSFLIETSFAQTQQRSFAFSEQWKALLHYRKTLFKNQSRAHHREFFLSQTGHKDILAEYEANLQSLKNDPTYVCRFPARATALLKDLNQAPPDLSSCAELNDWLELLGHDEISLLFAGAYANNPASLFGHTFLKFSKEGRHALLNYVVAFLARTDPRDSAPVYTWKGLTGGYLGFFEIEHFSTSIGLYNNSESRDLWEYRIPLTKDQRLMVAFHLWELIHHTGFPYYFTDENCSYLLLALLEVALPNIELTKEGSVFVMPIETVKYLKENYPGVEFSQHRQSLQTSITQRLESKDLVFVKDYLKIQKERHLLTYSEDVEMLDLLVDTYHLKNYREKTNLSQEDKQFMYSLLKTRAALDQTSAPLPTQTDPSRPDLSHSPKRLRLSANKEQVELELSYGLHRLIEPSAGYEDFSFIDFFQFEGKYDRVEKKIDFTRFSLIDISSWEPITRASAGLSWQVEAQTLKEDRVFETRSFLNIKGGPGLAMLKESFGSAIFLGLDTRLIYSDRQTRVLPYFEWQNFWRPETFENFSFVFKLNYFWHDEKSYTVSSLEFARHLARNLMLSLKWESLKIQSLRSSESFSGVVTYRF